MFYIEYVITYYHFYLTFLFIIVIHLIYFLYLIMIDNHFHNDPILCNDPANLNYNVDQASPYRFLLCR